MLPQPYPYPSSSDALAPPVLIKDKHILHEFKWGGKFWIQNSPASRLFQQIAHAKQPYQQRFTSTFISLLPKAPRRIIDVGANVGIMSLAYSKVAKRVAAFEPTPKTIEMLTKNLVLNGASHNVDVFPIALSNVNTLANFIDWHDHAAINGLAASATAHLATRRSSTCIQVECMKLDDFNFNDVDGIKIDTEGAELFVLEGAERTINNCKPILQIELMETSLRRFKLHPQDVFVWCLDHGYHAFNTSRKRLPNKWRYVRGESDIFFIHNSTETIADLDPFNRLVAFS